MSKTVKEKLDNFWYYNKVKVIVGVIAIAAVAAYFALGYGNRKIEPDVQIGYLTDGRTLPDDVVKGVNELLASCVKDVNSDKISNIAFVPINFGPKIDMDIISGESQIIMMDGDSVKKFARVNSFQPLDDVVTKHGLDISGNPEVRIQEDETKETHIFALPLKNIKFLLNAGFPSDNYYLAVRAVFKGEKNTVRHDNAMAILDKMLEEGVQ